MSDLQIVSLVAMVGWLALALTAYSAHQVGAKKTIVMALTWFSIFAFVAAVFFYANG